MPSPLGWHRGNDQSFHCVMWSLSVHVSGPGPMGLGLLLSPCINVCLKERQGMHLLTGCATNHVTWCLTVTYTILLLMQLKRSNVTNVNIQCDLFTWFNLDDFKLYSLGLIHQLRNFSESPAYGYALFLCNCGPKKFNSSHTETVLISYFKWFFGCEPLLLSLLNTWRLIHYGRTRWTTTYDTGILYVNLLGSLIFPFYFTVILGSFVALNCQQCCICSLSPGPSFRFPLFFFSMANFVASMHFDFLPLFCWFSRVGI